MYDPKVQRRFTINVNRAKHPDVINKLEKSDNITTYIINLIEKDVNGHNKKLVRKVKNIFTI